MRVDPLPTSAELAAYYARTYDQGIYDPYAAADDIRCAIAAYRLRTLGPLTRPGRWLDVGCGAGHFVTTAAAAGHDAQGIDVAAGAVARARARGARVTCGDLEALAAAPPFDTITAFDVLEHALDPVGFIRHLRRLLAERGILVLTLPNVQSLYPRLLMRRHWFYYAPNDHLYYFDRTTVSRLLGTHGFVVRSVRRTYKPLSLRYAIGQLRQFNPRIGRVATAVGAAVPRALATALLPVYLGEMLVVATASG